MKKDIASIREEFKKGSLTKQSIDANPLVQFEKWLNDAINATLPEPTAMILSTADKNAKPSSRTVLLKGVDDGGFVFFTNYQSRKGKQLNENPQAAITFFWNELERQVNITGEVQRVSENNSDEYFQSRPRKSRLGAWASSQSEELINREELMANFAKYTLQYAGRDVPRPSHWGGFRLIPDRVEFWQGRPSRLHDRIEYQYHGGQWKIRRLSP